MTTETDVKQNPSEWTGKAEEVEENETQNEAVYVAMQPSEHGGVEVEEQMEQTVVVQDCEEVVLVAEGSEVVEDIAETVQLGETHIVPVGAEEVYEEAFIVPKEEKLEYMTKSYNRYGNYSKDSNRHSLPSKLQQQLDAAATPQSTWSSVDFSRPSFTSPKKYYKSIGHYRPGAGKSLAKMRRMEQQRESSDSEDDLDPPYMPEATMLPHKTPKRREFAHRLQWRNRDMLEAMKAVEEQKQTIRGAAKKFNVPYSTLKDRVHGRVRHGAKPGVKTILSPEEEEELAKFVRDMENAGFQLRCVDVRDRAAELLRLNHGHNSPYKDGSPGHNWFHGFVKRHPGLEFKRTVKRNIVPSITKQKHMLRRFYDITACIFKKNKLSHKSDRIFSVSELRIGGQFEATILYAASANGSLIPPFVIFRGNALKLNAARQEYPEAFFTCSYDGRVNEDIFLWWFRDHYLKKVPTSSSRPGICFISRGVHDITMQLVQLAKEERMNLVGMAFGISHLVQPLDDDVSDMIRNAFSKRFKRWQDENPGLSVTQKVVAAVLRKVWNKINPEEIAAKFTANGIYPLNAYAITQDKLLTGAHILREMVERSPPRQEPIRQSQPPQNLSGLNLLSALSSQEYASLDLLGSNSNQATANSFESQSDVSFNDSLSTSNNMVESTPGYKVMFKTQPGKENEVVVVPLNETSESGVVEQVEVESSEHLETEIVQDDVPIINEQLAELMQKQREMQAKRQPRGIDLLQRSMDVREELVASRENEQISKAVDSILGTSVDSSIVKNEPRSPSTRSCSPEPEMDQLPEEEETISKPEVAENQHDDNTTVIRIAPDKIKDEISKAIQSGSFSKTNTLKLSDFHGNDIKIQIRIKNPDELRELSGATNKSSVGKGAGDATASGTSHIKKSPEPVVKRVPRIIAHTPNQSVPPKVRASISTPTSSLSSPASTPAASNTTRYRIIQSPKGVQTIRLSGGQGNVTSAAPSQGRFIQVSAPGSNSNISNPTGTRSVVIQSSQIRTTASIVDSADLETTDIPTTTRKSSPPKIEFKPMMKVEKVQESLPSQFFEDDDDQQHGMSMEVEEEIVQEETTTTHEIMTSGANVVETFTSQEEIVTSQMGGGSGDVMANATTQQVMTPDGKIMHIVMGDNGEQYVVQDSEEVEVSQEEAVEDCTVEYINADGEVIQVQQVTQ